MTFSLRSFVVLVVAGGVLTACEQVEQHLPFDAAGDPVTRTVGAGAVTISTAAGASLQVPTGAVAPGTSLTLTPVAAPGVSPSGTPTGSHAFVFGGGGTRLAAPVTAEFRVPRSGEQLWLASAVVGTPVETRELGDAGVDLAAGVLRTAIPLFGTITPVIPAAGAVVEVQRTGAPAPRSQQAASPSPSGWSPTRVLRGECGDAAARCTTLEVRLSDDLFDYADLAAIVFPRVSGAITISGGRASGSVELSAPVRLRLRSGAGAVTVPVRVTATPTAATVVTEVPGRITLSAVQVRVESSKRTTEERIDLVVHYEGDRARFAIERAIGASLGGAGATPTFSASVPLVRVP